MHAQGKIALKEKHYNKSRETDRQKEKIKQAGERESETDKENKRNKA